MIDSRHPDTVFLGPGTMLPGDPEVRANNPHGCDPAQAHDDLRLDQRNLVTQVTDTGILLCLQGIPVSGGRHLTILAI